MRTSRKSQYGIIAPLFLLTLVSACATEPLNAVTSNEVPIAKAGEDRTARVGDTIEVDGSTSVDADGDTLTYSWSLVAPGSSAATLTNDNYVTTTFQPDVPGEYRVSLVVSDGLDESEPDVVIVTVGGDGGGNMPPVAAVSGPTTVEIGTLVMLDGTQSSDPDDDGIFFDWLLEGGPEGSSARLDDPLSPTPTFTPDLPGDYELSLVVTDGNADSEPAPILITATAPANLPPIADAGPDRNVATGDDATLDASGCVDPEGADLLYIWSIISAPAGSSAVLSDDDTASPTLRPDVDGSYEVQLVVSDGEAESMPDSVIVTAVTGNVPPNADAGPDQMVEIGTLVQLDGSGSFDNEDDALTYQWSIISQPQSSGLSLANPLDVNPRFTPSAVGTYEIQLIVSDGTAESAPDTVTITTFSPNGAPTADAGSDRQGRVLDTISLDGSTSFDPDGDNLSYGWQWAFKPPSSNATLMNATSVVTTFEPDVAGTYTVMLTVTDGQADAMDTVTVTVTGPWPMLEGDLVITEVMADPNTLNDSEGEWFELYNPTNTAWDLEGCELSDLGGDSALINESVVVAPMSYVTLSRGSNPGFGPDYVYGGGFQLGNSGDELIVTCGASEIAQVPMLSAFDFPAAPRGASLALLRDHIDETDNDDGTLWCVSTTNYNGDFGTPGAPNEFQTACP